jgi:hypothetical protein
MGVEKARIQVSATEGVARKLKGAEKEMSLVPVVL